MDIPRKEDLIWLRALRAYLCATALGNLVWEVLQLPLYTMWDTGTLRQQAFAVAHCMLGDIVIAAAALILALLLAGDPAWPARRFWSVTALALALGITYTIFSEWLNVVVRASWAYSDRMPVVAAFGFRLGLAPVGQWIAVPAIGFAIMRRRTRVANGVTVGAIDRRP